MSITIASMTMEEYDSVDWLISELQSSETTGFIQVRDLVSDLPGFLDNGLADAEREGNYVRVFHFATFTDLLADSSPVRLFPVKPVPFPPQRQKQPKFAVYYRDLLSIVRNIHVFADTPEDAAEHVMEDGYGYADERPLYPRKIERVEPVPTTPFLN